jgi:hypothetical protein
MVKKKKIDVKNFKIEKSAKKHVNKIMKRNDSLLKKLKDM